MSSATATEPAAAPALSRPLPRPPLPVPAVPPLQNGDRLERKEFHRRWDAQPHLKKAELVEGVVFVNAALRYDWHGHPHGQLQTWLGGYAWDTPGVEEADNASIDFDDHNQPQPDGMLRIIEPCRGQSRVGSDGLLHGAPELAAEVSASSASYDLHDKLRVYQRFGVREYLVWRVLEEAVDWFVLREGAFVPLVASADGVLRSEVFPGLWLDPAALVRGQRARVKQVLDQGLASPEHAAFVAELAARRG